MKVPEENLHTRNSVYVKSGKIKSKHEAIHYKT